MCAGNMPLSRYLKLVDTYADCFWKLTILLCALGHASMQFAELEVNNSIKGKVFPSGLSIYRSKYLARIEITDRKILVRVYRHIC